MTRRAFPEKNKFGFDFFFGRHYGRNGRKSRVRRTSRPRGRFSFFVPRRQRVSHSRRAGIEHNHRRGGRKNAFAFWPRFIGRSASPRPHAPSGLNAFASNDFPDGYRRRALITLPERPFVPQPRYRRRRISLTTSPVVRPGYSNDGSRTRTPRARAL